MQETQLLINALLAGQRHHLRVYGSRQPLPHDIFSDLTTITRYVSRILGELPEDLPLPSEITALTGQHDAAVRPNRSISPSALDTAMASTIAAAILDAHNPAAAQHLLARVILAGNAGAPRMHVREALTPLVDAFYQRANEDARATLKLRRRWSRLHSGCDAGCEGPTGASGNSRR
jgi:hypothetical protein